MKAAVASALATAATSVFATGTLVSAAKSYAAEDVTSATNVFITASAIQYQAAATLVVGDLLTFTLSGGATFTGSTPPSLSANVGSINLFSATASSATYQMTQLASSTTLTMGSFSLTNTSLGSSTISSTDNCATAGANSIKVTVTGSVQATSDQIPTTSSAVTALVKSCSATTFTVTAQATSVAGAVAVADIVSGGKNFLASAAANSTTTVAQIGTYKTTFSTFVRATDGTTSNAPGTQTLTLSGNLSNISGFDVRTSTCAAAGAATGKISGTVTGNTATITAGAVTDATTYNVCITANGTGVLSGVNNAVSLASAVGMGGTVAGTDSLPGSLGGLGNIAYNGAVIRALYVTGGGSGGYTNYIRVANTGGATSTLYVSVATDGGTVLTGSLGTLAANSARLVSAADVNAASGSTLSAATDRGVVSIFGTGSIAGGNMVFNPNGTLATVP